MSRIVNKLNTIVFKRLLIYSSLKPFLFFFYCWLGGLSSCTTYRLPIQPVDNSYCGPTQAYSYDSVYTPQLDIDRWLKSEASLTTRFSRHSLLMINALGLLPQLKKLVQFAGDTTLAGQLEQIQWRQQIQSRLLLASTEIASLAAELDCEGERAEQLAYYLDQKDVRRIRTLTILSLITGAITTVATTLIQVNGATKMVGVGGGVISASFGGLAALSSDKQVTLVHQRNLLTGIWTNANPSSVYPAFIWYILHEKAFSNSGSFSIAHNIRERWGNYVLVGSHMGEQALYFGSGGQYTSDELHLRANMLNQLQSSIRSISQDLQSLQLGLANY